MKGLWRNGASLLFPLFCWPLLTGCWDRLDPENMAFIMAIGVDQGPRNDYIYTFAVAMPKSSSGAAGGGGGGSNDSSQKIVDVFSVEGDNLAATLLASQSFVARRLTLIHSKVFVLGEGIARQGVMPVLSEVVRNDEFRRTVNILTTKGQANAFIQHIKPKMEKDINLWFELELDPHNIGAVTPRNSRFHDFIADMEQPGTGGMTILSAASPDVDKGKGNISDGEDSSESESEPPITGDQYAGSLRRSGEVPVDFFGSAVYKGQKLAGFLTGAETKTLNMLRGEFEKTIWEFRDPSDPKYNLSINMNSQKKARMNLKRTKDQIRVTFHVQMEGDLMGSLSTVDYTQPENRKKLERSIENQMQDRASDLLDKTLYKWESDCFHIGNRLRANFPTLQKWYAYKWREHIKETKYELDIRFRMRRHGDQVGPAVEGDKLKK
ncbi:Ger(x)C family spore germination protein [Cohnella endophytica]|nr:Ger(x)C family spore germination protein [Cohnella endophytica]